MSLNNNTAPSSPATDDAAERKYLQAEEAVQEARERLRKAEHAVGQAYDLPRRLRAALARGDQSVTAADLAAAPHAEERAALLQSAAKADLRRALVRGPHRPTVAVLLVDAVAAGLEVMDVQVVDERPTEGAEMTASLRQTGQAVTNLDGTLSIEEPAGVEVTYFRSTKHVRANWGALEEALRAAGHVVTVKPAGSTSTTDTATILVHSAWSGKVSATAPVGVDVIGAATDAVWGGMQDRLKGVMMSRPRLRNNPNSAKVERKKIGGEVVTTLVVPVAVELGTYPVFEQGKGVAQVLSITKNPNAAEVSGTVAGLGELRTVEGDTSGYPGSGPVRVEWRMIWAAPAA